MGEKEIMTVQEAITKSLKEEPPQPWGAECAELYKSGKLQPCTTLYLIAWLMGELHKKENK